MEQARLSTVAIGDRDRKHFDRRRKENVFRVFRGRSQTDGPLKTILDWKSAARQKPGLQAAGRKGALLFSPEVS